MGSADTPERISSFLVDALMSTWSLNAFLARVIPEVSAAFGASRGMLLDYRENTGRFDLLYFAGYSEQARFELQRRLREMDLAKAVEQKQPYMGPNSGTMFLPLYFMEILEAVIVIETDGAIELTPERLRIAAIVSRFVGLLMSSNRLSINQTGVIDFDDLERAREIQQSYLPVPHVTSDHYEFYGYNQSSNLVGGDYFDYFTPREKALQCVLADASGHGLSAALIMSSFRASLRSEIQRGTDFSALFTVLNQSVHSDGSIAQYLTGVFFDFDETDGGLRYINAGHYDPAIVGRDGSIARLTGGGPPLGMFENSRYPTGAAKVQTGDLMVLFTDGFTDIRNSSDELFGEERILDGVASNRNAPLKEIADALLSEGIAFSATPEPEDDLTLLLLRFY
jgi:serine phosphatase RsbU (regulator of sigma subunit)